MSKAAELAKWGEVSTNGQVSGRRNIVYNGGMQVAQRSASETGLGAASGYFTCDRWFMGENDASAGRFTMSQTADGPVGFANCLKLDCTTADTSIAAGELLQIIQKFEGQDLQSIGKGVTGAKEITVSFYVKANAAFDFAGELYDYDNTRQISRLFSTTTDWVRHEFTFPADVDDGSSPFGDDNAASLQLGFFLHGGSTFTSGTLNTTAWANATNANRAAGIDSFFSSTDNNFFITGVQMEVGSVATPFEHRSFGEELQLCKRYFNQIGGQTAYQNIIQTMWISDNTAVSPYYHRPALRATPTIAKLQNYSHLGPGTIGQTLSTDQNGLNSVQFGFSGGSGGTSGISVVLRGNNNSGVYITFDAEL